MFLIPHRSKSPLFLDHHQVLFFSIFEVLELSFVIFKLLMKLCLSLFNLVNLRLLQVLSKAVESFQKFMFFLLKLRNYLLLSLELTNHFLNLKLQLEVLGFAYLYLVEMFLKSELSLVMFILFFVEIFLQRVIKSLYLV